MVTQKRSISIYRQLPTAVPSGTPISTNIRSERHTDGIGRDVPMSLVRFRDHTYTQEVIKECCF